MFLFEVLQCLSCILFWSRYVFFFLRVIPIWLTSSVSYWRRFGPRYPPAGYIFSKCLLEGCYKDTELLMPIFLLKWMDNTLFRHEQLHDLVSVLNFLKILPRMSQNWAVMQTPLVSTFFFPDGCVCEMLLGLLKERASRKAWRPRECRGSQPSAAGLKGCTQKQM